MKALLLRTLGMCCALMLLLEKQQAKPVGRLYYGVLPMTTICLEELLRPCMPAT